MEGYFDRGLVRLLEDYGRQGVDWAQTQRMPQPLHSLTAFLRCQSTGDLLQPHCCHKIVVCTKLSTGLVELVSFPCSKMLNFDFLVLSPI